MRAPFTYAHASIILAQVPDLLLADAKRVEVELRRKYLSDADGPTAHATADGNAGADAPPHAFGPLEVRRNQADLLIALHNSEGRASPQRTPAEQVKTKKRKTARRAAAVHAALSEDDDAAAESDDDYKHTSEDESSSSGDESSSSE